MSILANYIICSGNDSAIYKLIIINILIYQFEFEIGIFP